MNLIECGSGMLAMFVGCWSLSTAFPNITSLGIEESEDVKALRQFHNLGSWDGCMIGYGLWSFNGGQDGYFGCPLNTFWNLLFVFMTAHHLKFAGGPEGVFKKLKLASILLLHNHQ